MAQLSSVLLYIQFTLDESVWLVEEEWSFKHKRVAHSVSNADPLISVGYCLHSRGCICSSKRYFSTFIFGTIATLSERENAGIENGWMVNIIYEKLLSL